MTAAKLPNIILPNMIKPVHRLIQATDDDFKTRAIYYISVHF
jgi:hypothetical protein